MLGHFFHLTPAGGRSIHRAMTRSVWLIPLTCSFALACAVRMTATASTGSSGSSDANPAATAPPPSEPRTETTPVRTAPPAPERAAPPAATAPPSATAATPYHETTTEHRRTVPPIKPSTPVTPVTPVTPCSNQSITLASGVDWPSYAIATGSAAPLALGPAKLVCVNATAPYKCPANAVNYGRKDGGWTVDRTAIPNALWIWRGDALAAGAANQASVVFERSFTLGPNPSGTLYIAADDFAEVSVNGVVVGSSGSVSDQASAVRGQAALTKLILTPHLREGVNQLAIRAQNGPWGCSGKTCTYTQAPAGVVFGGTLESTCRVSK